MPYTEEQHEERRRSITAVMMRSGTSKGLFIHRDHLPANMDAWNPILLSAMGSATGDKRQLDGVGGATSTTSKVAVVGKSEREDADIDYTFAQVAVGSKSVDMSGNCGNMASGVGPFALDEGLVTAGPGQREVRKHLLAHPELVTYNSPTPHLSKCRRRRRRRRKKRVRLKPLSSSTSKSSTPTQGGS